MQEPGRGAAPASVQVPLQALERAWVQPLVPLQELRPSVQVPVQVRG